MKNLLILFLTFSGHLLIAQLDHQKVIQFSDSMIQHGISVPMIPGAILSVVSSDSIYHIEGYGFSNYTEEIPVDPTQTLFQLGSVGKILTAIAVLQQVESNQLELSKNVNEYLEDWKIENSFDKDITLFDLLTHTAGFNDHVIGYMARSENDILSLDQHLKKNMPTLFQTPGTNINYSNYSYALAGHLAELSSGKSFSEYINSEIFEPLDLLESTYYLPDDYQNRPNYARGYQWRETFNEVKSHPRHALPAGSILSTASDMALLMQALLKKDTTLLTSKSFDFLLTQQFTNHRRLTGYTLGMEVQNFNGNFAVAKSGQVPGFLSVLLLFPDDDLGIFLSFNTETDNFLELFTREFKQAFFPPEVDVELHALDGDVSDYVGSYGNLRTNHETIEELFMLYEGQFQFHESTEEGLMAYHNGAWHEYVMIDQDVFQSKLDPTQYAIFQRTDGEISGMYRNVLVGGIQVPSSYRRLGWFERPRFMNDEYPFLLLVVPSYGFLVLAWIAIFFIRKRKSQFLQGTKIPAFYHATALLFLLLFIWNIIGFFLPLLQNRQELFFDFNQSLLSMRYFNWAMSLSSIALLVLTFFIWLRQEGNWVIRVYYSLYSLVCLSYILILHRWHFLHITYQ